MDSQDNSPTVKLLIIGPSGSGKSALLMRYVDDYWDPESSAATIGVDFKTKKLSVNSRPVRCNILDTAGQERFRTLSNSYYRGAHGIVLVYSIASRESFEAMGGWFDEAEQNAPEAIKYLVGSKLDRSANRAITYEEGAALAETHRCAFTEVSAKTRENIRKPFIDLVDEIMRKNMVDNGARRGASSLLLGVSEANSGSGCSC